MNETPLPADPYAGHPGSRTLDADGRVISEEKPTQQLVGDATPGAGDTTSAAPLQAEASPDASATSSTERSFADPAADKAARTPRKGA